MNKKEFVSKIKSLKSNIIFNDSFFDSNKEKFLNYVSSEFGNETVNNRDGFNLTSFINRFRVPGFVFGASAALFVCGGFTVSASLNSLPGDPLYSIKMSFEGARSAVAFNDEDSVGLQVEFAGNRINELSQVLMSNRVNKQKIASGLVGDIDKNLSTIPNRVVALNKDKSALEDAAKNFDNKINEYSGKLKDIKKVASNAGMQDLSNNINSTYIKSNHISVKTLSIVVQNIDLSSANDVLKKDIIDRVEKKIDNIKDVVNNDSNDIISKSSLTNDGQNSNINTNSNTNKNDESAVKPTLSDQLDNMKQELNKMKVGLASADMASIISGVDKGLDNSSVTAVINYTNENINVPINLEDKKNPSNSNVIETAPIKKDDVKMQLESGVGYGLNNHQDFGIESLWSDQE